MTYMNHNLVSFAKIHSAAKIHIAKNLDKINMAKLIF